MQDEENVCMCIIIKGDRLDKIPQDVNISEFEEKTEKWDELHTVIISKRWYCAEWSLYCNVLWFNYSHWEIKYHKFVQAFLLIEFA